MYRNATLGLPTFPSTNHHHHLHQSRSYDGGGGGTSTGGPVAGGGGNLNEAFVNSFGLSSSAFLNPYFSDRTRTPSPLHRFLHSQLLGGQYMGPTTSGGSLMGGGEHHFSLHDDLLLDSGSPFRGLNLSTSYGGVSTAMDDERHRSDGSDPLISSGHLSRSLDDLSVMLDNSNGSGEWDAFWRADISPTKHA